MDGPTTAEKPTQEGVFNSVVQNRHVDAIDAEGETVEVDPTIPEEMCYDEVRRSLARYERVLERRTKRHGHEVAAVEDQQQLIATRQSVFVHIQSTADTTLAEMQEIRATIAQLTDWQAALAAERAAAPSRPEVPDAKEGSEVEI